MLPNIRLVMAGLGWVLDFSFSLNIILHIMTPVIFQGKIIIHIPITGENCIY